VLPSDQGLGSNHLAAAHVYFGLVMQNKLAALQRDANALQVFIVVTGAAVLRCVKNAAKI
jgi:hypothetical protein